MDERSKVLVNLLASGVSGGIGAALTNPLEVLKVRFQVSPPGGGVTMRAFARDVVAAEGAVGLAADALGGGAGGASGLRALKALASFKNRRSLGLSETAPQKWAAALSLSGKDK